MLGASYCFGSRTLPLSFLILAPFSAAERVTAQGTLIDAKVGEAIK